MKKSRGVVIYSDTTIRKLKWGKVKKETFRDYLNNKYSKDEYLEILKHFGNDKDFGQLQNYMEEHWSNPEWEDLSEEKHNYLRNRIQKKIQQSIRTDKKVPVVRRLTHTINKIAAILLIPLLFLSVYFFYQWKQTLNRTDAFAEIHCPAGTRTKFLLPDGTTGWLNSGSSLKYPVHFCKNRNVELSGEAFFDVVKNRRSPFIVGTPLFDIQVLGTKFDVTAYPDDKLFEVTLESGLVQIESKRTNHKGALNPNHRFTFDMEKLKANVNEVDTRFYTSWKDGLLIFRNTPMSEVMKRLGRWYNVDFVCDDKTLLNIPYRLTIQDESLEQVLPLLALTAPIKFKIIEPLKRNDETYEKQKVIISRN